MHKWCQRQFNSLITELDFSNWHFDFELMTISSNEAIKSGDTGEILSYQWQFIGTSIRVPLSGIVPKASCRFLFAHSNLHVSMGNSKLSYTKSAWTGSLFSESTYRQWPFFYSSIEAATLSSSQWQTTNLMERLFQCWNVYKQSRTRNCPLVTLSFMTQWQRNEWSVPLYVGWHGNIFIVLKNCLCISLIVAKIAMYKKGHRSNGWNSEKVRAVVMGECFTRQWTLLRNGSSQSVRWLQVSMNGHSAGICGYRIDFAWHYQVGSSCTVRREWWLAVRGQRLDKCSGDKFDCESLSQPVMLAIWNGHCFICFPVWGLLLMLH